MLARRKRIISSLSNPRDDPMSAEAASAASANANMQLLLAHALMRLEESDAKMQDLRDDTDRRVRAAEEAAERRAVAAEQTATELRAEMATMREEAVRTTRQQSRHLAGQIGLTQRRLDAQREAGRIAELLVARALVPADLLLEVRLVLRHLRGEGSREALPEPRAGRERGRGVLRQQQLADEALHDGAVGRGRRREQPLRRRAARGELQ